MTAPSGKAIWFWQRCPSCHEVGMFVAFCRGLGLGFSLFVGLFILGLTIFIGSIGPNRLSKGGRDD